MGVTRIDWCDAVWNPVTGCTPISPACDHCYARRMARRLRGRCGYPAGDPFRVTMHEDRLDEPLHWKTPKRIFVCSMGDLFHPDVSDTFQLSIWVTIARSSRHTFLILTKRPERMAQFLAGRPSLRNVWLGVTAEDQEMAGKRIPILLKTPAAGRFVSCEPMLRPIHLAGTCRVSDRGIGWTNPLEGTHPSLTPDGKRGPTIDWVICGGETGPGARPMHPDWCRGLRDECEAAAVPFFFKGWGDWKERTSDKWVKYEASERDLHRIGFLRGIGKLTMVRDLPRHPREIHCTEADCWMERVGKKKAGHLLDGREWRQVPEVRQ